MQTESSPVERVRVLCAASGEAEVALREMVAKVVAREIGSAGNAVTSLVEDPVPRVRAAAARALGAVGEAEHVAAALAFAHDTDVQVRVRASRRWLQ